MSTVRWNEDVDSIHATALVIDQNSHNSRALIRAPLMKASGGYRRQESRIREVLAVGVSHSCGHPEHLLKSLILSAHNASQWYPVRRFLFPLRRLMVLVTERLR